MQVVTQSLTDKKTDKVKLCRFIFKMATIRMKFVFAFCFLVQQSFANNSDSDKTIQTLLQRLQKLEEIDQQRQVQFEALQQQVIKQEELLKSSCRNSSSDGAGYIQESHSARQKKLLAIGDDNTTTVAFHAWLKNEVVDVPAGYLIKMTNVKLNEGNGYNSNDGIFFCPKTGLYLFHWSGMPSLGKQFYLNLMINGVFYEQIHASSTPVFQTSSNLAIVRLNVGDHVLLQTAGSASSFHANYCSFSGVRLSG